MPRRKVSLGFTKPLAVLILTVALGCWGEIKAESVDHLVEEGVQIMKERHEIVHLQTIRQLDVRQSQEKLFANRQRWEQYTRKLPPQKKAAILERIKQKTPWFWLICNGSGPQRDFSCKSKPAYTHETYSVFRCT